MPVSIDSLVSRHEVIIVGAGLSGIAAAVKLLDAGITDFLIIEKAERVGGVWRENTYPNCCCDIPSALYSYSFSPSADWSNMYAKQPEIQRYIEQVAYKYNLNAYIRFTTNMDSAKWSEHEQQWHIHTSTGLYHAKLVIFAGGPLTEPSIPKVDGLKEFKGVSFHSANWNHEVDLSNKRVAVVGTGASSIQFIPAIQPSVKQLYVFQRTAPWVVPKPDASFGGLSKGIMRHIPMTQKLLRQGTALSMHMLGVGVRHPNVLSMVGAGIKKTLNLQIKNPNLRKKITPDFILGCKRILFSSDYYPALARDNVEVIASGVSRIEGNRIVATNGEGCEVDVLIWGTGFDVSHPPLAKKIYRRDGVLLSEHWQKNSPTAYVGCVVNGVPNAFHILGPNSLAYDSFIEIAEIQLDYVVQAIRYMQKNAVRVLEVTADAQQAYNHKIQTALKSTVFSAGGCVSYYLDDHGKNFAIYPWSLSAMRQHVSRFDSESYHVTLEEKVTKH